MPQFDYVFVIIHENESQSSVRAAAVRPYINSLLNKGGVYDNYYSTGDPSEPNYLALGGADDWGQNNDEVTAVSRGDRRARQPVQLHRRPGPDLARVRGLAVAVLGGHPGEHEYRHSWNTATGGLWFDNPADSSISVPVVASTTPTVPRCAP